MALRGGSNTLRMNGDWLCPRCGDLQFARNLQCRICGAGRPPFGGQAAMLVYEDGSYGGNGGCAFHGGYQSYPGSVPYQGVPSHQLGAYPLGPHGKGGPGRPQKGRGFNGNFNSVGKGQRGPGPPISLAPHRPKSSGGTSQASSLPAGSPEEAEDGASRNGAIASVNGGVNGGAHTALGGNEEDAGAAEEVVVETLDCPHHLAGAVIGRHGSAIAQLRRETRCHIEIEASPGNGAPRTVTVCGPRAAVKEALDRIKETLSQRSANVDQNGEGHFGPGGRVATDEDRQRTSRLIDSLEGRGVLRRSWLDERCMEVLMMLPFDVTGRVLHEAERVDLWKTRNVSAFLMMLVKTVQHSPDRRDGSDRMHYRPQHGAPPRPHGVRNDASHWGPPQGAFAVYGTPNGYLVPWVPGSYPQGYQEYTLASEYQVAYDPGYIQGYATASAQPAAAIVSAPASPTSQGFAAPGFVVGGSWDPCSSPTGAGSIALPVAAAGMGFEYAYANVSIVPASPQQCAQVQPEAFSAQADMDNMPLPPSLPYSGEPGTQTPEIGSEIGDVHESLLGIYPADVA